MQIPQNPRRFLISSLSHMGDVVLMTSLLPVLKRQYPHAHIGVLVGSWSLSVVENHPYIDQVHVVDHWKLNRSKLSLIHKWRLYSKTKKQALAEIRSVNYQIAMDAYYHFPNAIPICAQAKIPVRMGYTSAGFGPLLTHAVDWTNQNQSVIKYYMPLLDFLGIRQSDYLPLLQPYIPRTKKSGITTLLQKLTCDLHNGYIVIHIGTGSFLKEWSLHKWQELAKKLQEYPLIFTGKGPEERDKIQAIIGNLDHCFNMADKLDWEEFLTVIQDSRLLVSVDSLSGHLAAAFSIPSVLIFSGMTNIHHWTPVNKLCKVITNHVSCSPCYRSQGCLGMACIQNVSVEKVYAACAEFLTSKETKEANFQPQPLNAWRKKTHIPMPS